MTYAEQYRDPRWQQKRLEILDRDGWKCVKCSSADRQLHVHHIAYKKGAAVWDYEGEWLETVCSECHEATHTVGDETWSGIKLAVVKAAREASASGGGISTYDGLSGVFERLAGFASKYGWDAVNEALSDLCPHIDAACRGVIGIDD